MWHKLVRSARAPNFRIGLPGTLVLPVYRHLLIALFCCFAFGASNASRAPVLVELFTSEGCSSCPPADRVLQQLDADAIVLSEHVDYWDQLGWKDAFSSHSLTERQMNYGRQLGLDQVYTPEMVVDGKVEFNGGDGGRARGEIAKAAQRPKAQVTITRTGSGLQVDVKDAPHSATVFLAVADNADASQVGAGENKGHRLQHVSVLRELRKLGTVKKGGNFSLPVLAPAASQRLVVFVQESGQGAIEGAAVWMP